jgi:hypothetical protein
LPGAVVRFVAGMQQFAARVSLLANRPVATWPSATTQAPVRVATSITVSGSKRAA